MFAQEGVVTTGVDSLIALLKQKSLVSVEEAASILHVRLSIIQTWVDFLMEEDIIGVEYKFITPYIFLKGDYEKSKLAVPFTLKEDFYKKARARKISEDTIPKLWKEYVVQNMQIIRQQFYTKSEQKHIHQEKVDALWVKYKALLLDDD